MDPTKIALSRRLTSARSRRSASMEDGASEAAAARGLAIAIRRGASYVNRRRFAQPRRPIHLCFGRDVMVKNRRIPMSELMPVRQNGGRHMPYLRASLGG